MLRFISAKSSQSGAQTGRFTGSPSADAAKIYQALDVSARSVSVGSGRVGSRTLRKSVGGLVCEQISVSRYAGHYDCTLRPNNNGERIYAALNVTPQRDRRPIGGMIIDFKEVGNLFCREVRSVRPMDPRRTDRPAINKTTCVLR